MRRIRLLIVLAIALIGVGCGSHARPAPFPSHRPDSRLLIHVLNRTSFGPRPGDLPRLQKMGVKAYLEEQLYPERIPDDPLAAWVAPLTALQENQRTFAEQYYRPMADARKQRADDIAAVAAVAAVAAMKRAAAQASMGDVAMSNTAMTAPTAVRRAPAATSITVLPEEERYQRRNREVFEALQQQHLLRATYSQRQLQEVLTDFWFNHFNVDGRKIEDKPTLVEYERDVIRPYVFGRFRDLLAATAKSPAMLLYLDNWLNSAPPPPRPNAPPPPPGRGLNENYARELMELHTLGVDGGYTQQDVVEVARCFTGWTLHNHEGTGFWFNDKTHDRGQKRVLGEVIPAGRGIEDGEQVLDLLARHPSTAHFIATKLVRHFVADEPPPALVNRVAATFLRTNGDLREVMREILTSKEFSSAAAYRAKIKTPFEYVVSALRATNASITNGRSLVGTVAGLGEPLYQCQPPTGYSDRAAPWTNTGALIGRINFAMALVAKTFAAANVPIVASESLAGDALGWDIGSRTRAALDNPRLNPPQRTALLIGSPEFQRR